MQRRSLGQLALVASLVLAVQAVAVAAPEWRSLTEGHGWPACGTVEFVIDEDSLPAGVSQASVRDDLQAAAGWINAEIGRPMVTVAPGTTTADPAPGDSVNVVHFRTLSAQDDPGTISVNGYASPSWVTYEDGSGQIVDADIVLDDTDWAEAPAELRRITLAHELGHALGLDHVGDAHEIMSYGYVHDGDGLGAGTRQALQALYAGSDCSRRLLTESHDWSGLTANGPDVLRLVAGATATDVRALAIEMGQLLGAQWGGGQWATHAVVCRADLFPDCLAGAPLAGTRAPLVFVPGGPDGQLTTSDPTYQFLASAVPPGAPVYVLGGDKAVSAQVMDTLKARWGATQRLAGPTRYETAVAVARVVVSRSGTGATALVARGDNPADAVTGGAAAAAKGLPIVLTPSGSLHASTRAGLAEFGTTTTLVLGGEAAVGPAVLQALQADGRNPSRAAGRTRTETSVAIARHPALWGRTQVADGDAFVGLNGWHAETWAVALSSAPLAALAGAPVLLTRHDEVPYVAPRDGYPGETGWYLANLTGSGTVQMMFVGVGRWADAHARESFWQYLGLH